MVVVDTEKDEKILFIYLALIIVAIMLGVLIYLGRTTKVSLFTAVSVDASVVEAKASINSSGFSPATILIKKGDQITWVNNDDQPHQIASGNHPIHDIFLGVKGFESPILQPKESFTFEAERVGSFNYHDESDPTKILGTVIVQ